MYVPSTLSLIDWSLVKLQQLLTMSVRWSAGQMLPHLLEAHDNGESLLAVSMAKELRHTRTEFNCSALTPLMDYHCPEWAAAFADLV